jgi:hypothetical protein
MQKSGLGGIAGKTGAREKQQQKQQAATRLLMLTAP